MTGLPRALAPWAKQLAIFPEPVALAVGDLASRLSGILGALGAEAAREEGIVDGFDGLARRGSYERLLVTEWLLQEEVPEEFVRRAVSGEHSFLKRAHRRPTQSLRSCVLFDAGPEQLGAPRIAHLAALVVLAQRAERANAGWTWGVLQDGTRELHTEVNAVTVQALLRARCRRPASRDDVNAWRAAIPASSELWLVGAERLEAEAERCKASFLAVSEVLEPAAPARLRARVGSRAVTLALPPAPLATRLLRDPFEAATAPRTASKVAIDPKSSFLFSVDGRLLYARGAGRSLITLRVPNSPRAAAGRSAVFVPPGRGVVVAVGQSDASKRFALVQEDDRVALHQLSKRGALSHSARYFEPIAGCEPPTAGVGWPLIPLGVLSQDQVCFVNCEDDLVELYAGRLRSWPAPIRRQSRAIRGGLAYIDVADGTRRITLMVAKCGERPGAFLPQAARVDLSGVTGDLSDFFFGGGDELFAWCGRRSSTWTILTRKGPVVVSVDEESIVVGVTKSAPASDRETTRPWLVVLDRTRTRISLVDPQSSETIITTTSPILHATASDASYDVAYLTGDGELGVYSCWYRAMLLRTSLEIAS